MSDAIQKMVHHTADGILTACDLSTIDVHTASHHRNLVTCPDCKRSLGKPRRKSERRGWQHMVIKSRIGMEYRL